MNHYGFKTSILLLFFWLLKLPSVGGATCFEGSYSGSVVVGQYTHTETDSVSGLSAQGSHVFSNGAINGSFEWTATIQVSPTDPSVGLLTGTGTIHNLGVRAFTLDGTIEVHEDRTASLVWRGNDPKFGPIGGRADRIDSPCVNLYADYIRWNVAKTGVEIAFQIQAGRLSKAVTAKVFWADESKAMLKEVFTHPIAAGTSGKVGPIAIPDEAFAANSAPPGAAYLMLVLDPDELIFEADVDDNYDALPISVIVAKGLTWNLTNGNLELDLSVGLGALSQPVAAKLYWASGPGYVDRLLAAPPIYTGTIPQGASGFYKLVIPAESLSSASRPDLATHIMIMIDPVSLLEDDPSDNEVHMKLGELPAEPIELVDSTLVHGAPAVVAGDIFEIQLSLDSPAPPGGAKIRLYFPFGGPVPFTDDLTPEPLPSRFVTSAGVGAFEFLIPQGRHFSTFQIKSRLVPCPVPVTFLAKYRGRTSNLGASFIVQYPAPSELYFGVPSVISFHPENERIVKEQRDYFLGLANRNYEKANEQVRDLRNVYAPRAGIQLDFRTAAVEHYFEAYNMVIKFPAVIDLSVGILVPLYEAYKESGTEELVSLLLNKPAPSRPTMLSEQWGAYGIWDAFAAKYGIDLEKTRRTTAKQATPAGKNAQARGSIGVSEVEVTFTEVKSPGETTFTRLSDGPPPPTGYSVLMSPSSRAGVPPLRSLDVSVDEPAFFAIKTSAEVNGLVALKLRFADFNVPVDKPASVSLMQYSTSSSQWSDITAAVDQNTGEIWGTTDVLSFFGLFALDAPANFKVFFVRDGNRLVLSSPEAVALFGAGQSNVESSSDLMQWGHIGTLDETGSFILELANPPHTRFFRIAGKK